ncbi:thioredoxin-dependent phosophoadenylyl-sulfate reductase [Actinobacteria bacterium IMCC26256]|nr:thioredoxin-dependent phosophoadenylyl-sulfate reductase [Actinobacteria bacterium IMCC26256]
MTHSLELPRLNTPDLAEISRANEAFENSPASRIIVWAAETFENRIVLASSFQDAVLVDLVARTVPGLPVVFLDTGYHFAETLWYAEQLRRRYDLDVEIMAPVNATEDQWMTDTDACCKARKVEPLERALLGRDAWMTGLRRSETAQRRNAPIVSYDIGRAIVKVNPIATWTDLDIEGYVKDHDLPVHPLSDRGYASIGCWPCTRQTSGDDSRSGRWASIEKTECGIHD